MGENFVRPKRISEGEICANLQIPKLKLPHKYPDVHNHAPSGIRKMSQRNCH